jgi:hypothetical protein
VPSLQDVSSMGRSPQAPHKHHSRPTWTCDTPIVAVWEAERALTSDAFLALHYRVEKMSRTNGPPAAPPPGGSHADDTLSSDRRDRCRFLVARPSSSSARVRTPQLPPPFHLRHRGQRSRARRHLHVGLGMGGGPQRQWFLCVAHVTPDGFNPRPHRRRFVNRAQRPNLKPS